MLRLLLVGPFVLLVMQQRIWPVARYLALGLFVAVAVSDAVDGVLARRMGAKTRLGAILDPLADKALVICAVVLLSLPHTSIKGAKLDSWVVVFVVGKDLWVILGFLVIYLVTDRLRVQPTLVGKATTLGQLLMIGFVLIGPDLNRLGWRLGTRVVLVMSWAVAGLSVLAVIGYTRLGLRFIAEDQKLLEEKPRQDLRTDD